jgi:hypothetical protein
MFVDTKHQLAMAAARLTTPNGELINIDMHRLLQMAIMYHRVGSSNKLPRRTLFVINYVKRQHVKKVAMSAPIV